MVPGRPRSHMLHSLHLHALQPKYKLKNYAFVDIKQINLLVLILHVTKIYSAGQ